MSLDTVIKIGNVLRNSGDNLKYFKLVECCPQKKGEWPICISIPVNSDFSFDWEHIRITPENQRDNLCYLAFKASGSDSSVKYIFGDIFYEKNSIKKDGSVKEGGNYRLENPNHSKAELRLSSFFRGRKDFEDIYKDIEGKKHFMQVFHEKLHEEIIYIERILKYAYVISNEIEKGLFVKALLEREEKLYDLSLTQYFQDISPTHLKKAELPTDLSLYNDVQKRKLFDMKGFSVFIHFEFDQKQHWYHFEDDFNLLYQKILSEFVERDNSGNQVFKKSLYKTLCSGTNKNDIQFPAFRIENKHKSRSFQGEELQDLFYALDYTNKGKLISGTDIKLIVLPQGESLTEIDYIDFFTTGDELRIVNANETNEKEPTEPLFDFISQTNDKVTSFDLIFCKNGGLASPDVDLIEISGIGKSKLQYVKGEIKKSADKISIERKEYLKTAKDLKQLNLASSFASILGSPQCDERTGRVSYKATPKYQSHLLKVLPLIFLENYCHDEMLLPAFIQNVLYIIRTKSTKCKECNFTDYSYLKYNLEFLLSIQNNKNNKFMEITTSESYQIGYMLGGLAKNLSRKINSFEKNYVGNLIRRIGNLPDFIKMKNEIDQKLIMHDKAKFTNQTSFELSQKIKDFKSKYDKEESAFGFLEAYFKPLPKKEQDEVTNN